MSVLKSIYMLKVSPALHPHAGVQHLFMEVAPLETVASQHAGNLRVTERRTKSLWIFDLVYAR